MRFFFGSGLGVRAFLGVGLVFAVAGAGLWVFTWSSISSREQQLAITDMSAEERWRVEGSLQWWRDFGSRLSYPLGVVLLVGGLLTIAVSDPLKKRKREAEILIGMSSG